ncbi:hypothetical protein PILCRDRAFT_1635 [Piloderma croceum F 1598]|uniref:Histone chaperone domain-containing protein n=1 Tax=Piloderma croceum (strain F 1598) TaxID=765440 RepID=A0A0C3CKW5_PILCF|nr:hypothetical protein PILCRDRAFT_1635 [Piloderma croceum F 1598]
MASPALSDITAATKEVIKNARKQNRLSTLTPRLIRKEVEQALKLDAGTLDTNEYKDALKAATEAALAQDNDSGDDAPIQSASKPAVKGRKRKSDDVESEAPVKTVKKPQPKTVKKPKLTLGEATEAEQKRARNNSSPKKVFKSAAMIETSDEEEEGETVAVSKTQSKLVTPVMKVEPQKQTRKPKTSIDKEPAASPSSKSKPQSGHLDSDFQGNAMVKPGPSTLKLPLEPKPDDGDKSESEMSILIDATPIKRGANLKKREKAPGKAKKESKEKKVKKSTTEVSKDEEAVKRLKSYVYACGVRKVWTKEFQNLPTPLQQVKRLKEILADLGMDGRLSMEKAKAIKTKRDLAKELEDVKSFEQTVVGEPSRNRSKAKSNNRIQGTDSVSRDGDGDGSASDSANDVPTKHKNAARRSIMAFLGDDSDEE